MEAVWVGRWLSGVHFTSPTITSMITGSQQTPSIGYDLLDNGWQQQGSRSSSSQDLHDLTLLGVSLKGFWTCTRPTQSS